MPTSAARPKLCTCILIHPSPRLSLGAELFSNYRQEKGSFPREGEAKAGSGQEQAGVCARFVGCSQGCGWPPGSAEPRRGELGSSGGFAGFISRRKGKEEG